MVIQDEQEKIHSFLKAQIPKLNNEPHFWIAPELMHRYAFLTESQQQQLATLAKDLEEHLYGLETNREKVKEIYEEFSRIVALE